MIKMSFFKRAQYFFKKQPKSLLIKFGFLVAILLLLPVTVAANYYSTSISSRASVGSPTTVLTLRNGLNGYNGTRDTLIAKASPNKNFGDTEQLRVSNDTSSVSLVKFDLSSIPQNAQVQSANLTINQIPKTRTTPTATISLHKVLANWNENQATWPVARRANNKNILWGAPGASAFGVDIEAQPVATTIINSTQPLSFSLTSTVQLWLQEPSANKGVIIRGDQQHDHTYIFASSENSTKNLRPSLSITYSVPQPTPTPVPSPLPTPTPAPTPTATPLPTPFPSSTPLPTPTPNSTPFPVPNSWLNVDSWTYQLSDYANNNLNEIRDSAFDLAVIDLARSTSAYVSDYFTATEIQAVRTSGASGKFVLAYFEIGAMETYRPEWEYVDQTCHHILLGPVGGWPGERYVKYWDDCWWPVVKGRVDQAIAAGYDGAYLDMIVTYEEIPAGSAGTNRQDLANKMVTLIKRTSEYAKQQKPNFKIAPQNSPELYTEVLHDPDSPTNENYINSIDGIGMEEMFFMDTDVPCAESWCNDNRDNASAIKNYNKLVLAVDYANQVPNIESAYSQARARSFAPYTSVRDLNVMRVNDNCTTIICDPQ